ncbi:MAG: cytidine deaminase [Dehalococcoidia bacterium]
MEVSAARIDQALHEAALARDRAYAPYSRFKMGAAVLTDVDSLMLGSLVENVSFGLTMCAERVALAGTVAMDAGRPRVLALVAPATAGALTWPCGACLQVAIELGGPELLVVVSDGADKRGEALVRELAGRLPFTGL